MAFCPSYNLPLTSTEIKKLLGVTLSRMKSKNIPLSYLSSKESQNSGHSLML